MSFTTITSWALLLWNTLEDLGYDSLVCFNKAGVDPVKLRDGQARYPADVMPRLWQAAVEQTHDHNIGVEAGKRWNPTTFHALGFAWLASRSLAGALEKVVRFSHIVNNSLIVSLRRNDGYYEFAFTTADKHYRLHPAGNDAAVVALIRMCQLLVGNDFSPVALYLMSEYQPGSRIEEFVGVNAEYGAAQNSFLIDPAIAEKDLTTGNASLVLATEQAAREYLQWLDKKDVVSAVKSRIIELLPSGQINEALVADKVNMNVRTLQRRLKEQDLTFKQIVNATRQEIVHNHIHNFQLSLTEIAYLLGFADQANFTRAYKRWTGLPPSEHRKLLLERFPKR